MRILVKLPSRSRPQSFVDAIQAYESKAEGPFTWLFSLDSDDPTMQGFPNAMYGLSSSKIHAINRDINEHGGEWDILVVASDDMLPIAEGWDSIIRRDMQNYFPDTDGCLWYHDGRQGTPGHPHLHICTLPVIGRKYYERTNRVYHESYLSFFCDNEETARARALGKMTDELPCIIRHEHPHWGGSMPYDTLYKSQARNWNADQRNFFKRRAKGFPE